MADHDKTHALEPTSHGAELRAALDAVCESEQFVNADRLKAFLRYVVDEAIAGRADQILGKTIAQDVYLRNMTAAGSRSNLVRVDAGRLRRKLDEYYDTAGRADRIRIHIDSGGYAPWFEDRITPVTENIGTATQKVARKWLWTGLGAVALIGAVGVLAFWPVAPVTEPPQTQTNTAKLKALAAKSPATVQAENLCTHARGLLFPVASVDNQTLASDIFRQAIKSDPDYVCGYAGLGHSLGTSAILTPPGETRAAVQAEALQMAQKAVDLAPTSGWSQSALAWASYANGQFDTALTHSELAEGLAPRDGNVLDFRSLMLLVLGHFEEAYDVSHHTRPRETGSYRFAHRNIHAVASFHLGKYDEAIRSITYATENGDPVSALSLVILAASHEGLGERSQSQARLAQLRQAWPAFSAKRVVGAFYSDPAFATEILRMIDAAGWQEPV